MKIEEYAHNLGYKVTDDGVLMNPKGKIIKGSIRHKQRKYSTLYFNVRINSKKYHCSIHRLQAFQKFKYKIYEPHVVVRHIDNNSFNNSIDNIQIGSYKDNFKDLSESTKENILNSLKRNVYKKYDDELVKKVYIDFNNGMNRTEISNKYDIPVNSVYYVIQKYSND